MCAPPNLRSSGPFGSGAHRQKDREARRPLLPVFNFPGLIFYFRVACLIILPHDDHVIISLALHQGTRAAAARLASQCGVLGAIARRNVATLRSEQKTNATNDNEQRKK
jgi:hypothetical protein